MGTTPCLPILPKLPAAILKTTKSQNPIPKFASNSISRSAPNPIPGSAKINHQIFLKQKYVSSNIGIYQISEAILPFLKTLKKFVFCGQCRLLTSIYNNNDFFTQVLYWRVPESSEKQKRNFKWCLIRVITTGSQVLYWRVSYNIQPGTALESTKSID